MSLSDPPESLQATFDMHGARFEVVPFAQRTLIQNLRLMRNFMSLFGGSVGVGLVVAAGVYLRDAPAGFYLVAVALPVLCLALVLFFGITDEGERTERIRVRIGEGWLVMTYQNLGISERVDLSRCVRCTVVSGPDVVVHHVDQSKTRIPMRSHGLPAIGWTATAINQAIQDARHGDEPAPEALVAMLRPEG